MARIFLALLLILLPASHAWAGGITSSADPRATEAGQEMLRHGGNATDAAMAMLLALTVVEPQSSGIGGGGFLLHHDGKTRALDTIDGRETAPVSARPDRFMGADGKPLPFDQAFPGGRSVGVPGNVRLIALAHGKWGKLPWETLFQPAIRLARDGFMVNAVLASRLAFKEALWADFPEAQRIYWRDGKPAKEGDTLRNPDLAAFLQRMAKEGPEAFYSGQNADAISAAVQGAPRNPAEMSKADLAGYEAKLRGAICRPYRIYTVCGMGPPSSGAVTILQILGMLERFPMQKLGKDNPKSWHLIGEAMQLAYADRDLYLGDTDFVDAPVEGMLDHRYVKARARLISPTRALGDYPAGKPKGAAARTAAISSEVPSTTHFVAMDDGGDIVSMTSTVEGAFGSQLIANGYFLNNELTDFTFAPEKDGAPVANRVQAGKRPLSSMSPTIVYDRSGKPILALGSAGGRRIIMHVLKTLVGVLDFGLPVDQAIALPNIFFYGGDLLVERGSALEAMAPTLTAMGQPTRAEGLDSKVNALQWTPTAGWTGAADLRSPGTVLVK